MDFNSRRSVVHSVKGMAASTQPLASAVAVKLLEQGCNAIEAAVGCSAALAVVEPGMTSLGDAFVLYYNAKSGKVEGLNGSGKSSRNIDLAKVRYAIGQDLHMLPLDSAFSVNVPGAAAAWVDAVERWGTGRKTMKDILAPAIELARNGFAVSKISSDTWRSAEPKLQGSDLLINGERAPREGEIFTNEPLARVLERIAELGKPGFYSGATADAIVEAVAQRGGVLDHEDLMAHTSLVLEPISVPVLETGCQLWELPPNNHGVVALLTLNMMREALDQFPIEGKLKHNSAKYIHLLTECLKFAFKEAEFWVADPSYGALPSKLLSREYAAGRVRELFDPSKANLAYERGNIIPPRAQSDTSYYTVTDSEGNACSMISSLYYGFGSGIVPKDTGFALHNRGCNFSLDPCSKNVLGPSKRSYHTIIPAMLTSGLESELYAAFGVMGGFMQPQGHVQVALNLLLFGLDPQQALDSPRICLTPVNDSRGSLPVPHTDAENIRGVVLNLENGISPDVAAELERMGHTVRIISTVGRSLFGRGQVIVQDVQNGRRAYHAGSDPRGDGAAIPQV